MNMKKYLLAALILPLLIYNLFAQEQETSEPLSLPHLIIVDDARLNTRSGVKQMPDNPAALSRLELDSLNSLEKQPPPLLPVEPLPQSTEKIVYNKGFASVSFGSFTTPNVSAGYGFDVNGYKFYATGGFEMSEGHVENADYSRFDLNVISDYVAPEKYWIFGGSKTRINFDLQNKNYNLYAVDDAPGRNLIDLNIGVRSDGSHKSWDFSTGASFETLQLLQDESDGSDNGIKGFLEIKNVHNKYDLGGNIMVDFHSVGGDGVNFLQAYGFGTVELGKVKFRLRAGLQNATALSGTNRSALMLDGKIDYLINRNFTLQTKLGSGLRNRSYAGYARMNPYISDTADIDFTLDIAKFGGFLTYHPTKDLGITAGAEFNISDQISAFVQADSTSFDLAYGDGIEGALTLEGFYDMSPEDRLMAAFEYKFTSFGDENNILPYVPAIKGDINYKRTWFRNFGTIIGFYYIGSRYADIDNIEELSAYTDLYLRAEYSVERSFSVFFEVNNMLNSDIMIWNGYKERNLFASAGVLIQF